MKNRFFPALLLALGLSAPAFAADTLDRTLAMSGHGEVKAAPDLVTINAGVTTRLGTHIIY